MSLIRGKSISWRGNDRLILHQVILSPSSSYHSYTVTGVQFSQSLANHLDLGSLYASTERPSSSDGSVLCPCGLAHGSILLSYQPYLEDVVKPMDCLV